MPDDRSGELRGAKTTSALTGEHAKVVADADRSAPVLFGRQQSNRRRHCVVQFEIDAVSVGSQPFHQHFLQSERWGSIDCGTWSEGLSYAGTYLAFGERPRRARARQRRVDLLDAQNGFVAEFETHHFLVVTSVPKRQQDLSKYLRDSKFGHGYVRRGGQLVV